MNDELGTLFDSWLPKAEKWLEADREGEVSALVVSYATRAGQDRRPGWNDLPRAYQAAFAKSRTSFYRIGADSMVAIAKNGNLTGWRQLFSVADRFVASRLSFDPPLPIGRLNGEDRWVILLSNLLWRGFIDGSFGGTRQNLEPGYGAQIGESDTLNDVRFNIDLPTLPAPLKEQLKRSADDYGCYWRITDLRAATIDALHWFRSVIDASEPEPRNRERATGGRRTRPKQSANETGVAQTIGELPKRQRLAYLAANYAEAKKGRQLTDPEAWDYLSENGIEEAEGFGDYDLPMFDTFSRYVTQARTALGENRNQSRAGRGGRSVAKLSDI